jgi:hypothetical protein
MKRPNFFIVGAPKSGTTAMATYLKAHHDVFMPARKELGYFGSDLTYSKRFIRDPDEEHYLAHFSSWSNEALGGEASVWYLYSLRAAAEIRAFSPDARIIIMLRNPVDVLYSNYHQFLHNENEDIPVFEDALAAESARKAGRRLPSRMMLREGLYYRDTVRFAEQVERYLEVFGRARVYIILFDEFQRDTPQTFRTVLEFLDIDPDFTTDFEVINPNKRLRSSAFRHIYTSAPFRAATRRFPRLAQRVYGPIRALNTELVARAPLDPATRLQLTRELAPEVRKLAALLDCDLSGWLSL